MATKDPSNTDENTPAEKVEGQEPDETNDEGNEPDTEQEENSEEHGEENDEENEDGDDEENSKLSPEDALKALAKTRKSEAKYRTRLREMEQKLQDAKTPEEVEAAIKEIKDANAKDTRELLVENVALKHRLPDDLAEALKAFKADTREELEAHAKVLARYATVDEETDDPDVSGGLDPSNNPEGFDAKAEAQKMRRQRRRGR